MAEPDSPHYRILKAQIGSAVDKDELTQDVDRELIAILPDMWSIHDDRGQVSPRLQFLYAMRSAIEFWQTSVWRDVDYDEEVKESLRQKSINLATMHDQATTEIEKLKKEKRGSNVGAVGQTNIVGSLQPAPGSCFDPSDPIYRGDARYTRGCY